MRIFHSVDPHGSRLIWKKYLRAAVHCGADVIMLCGGVTGKALAPIVKKGKMNGNVHHMEKLRQITQEKKLRKSKLGKLRRKMRIIF